jgi:hypothetical protein
VKHNNPNKKKRVFNFKEREERYNFKESFQASIEIIKIYIRRFQAHKRY